MYELIGIGIFLFLLVMAVTYHTGKKAGYRKALKDTYKAIDD